MFRESYKLTANFKKQKVSHCSASSLACEKCNATFKDYIDLKNHVCIKIENCEPESGTSSNNPFSCRLCIQGFPTELLINHLENHTVLTCPFCNKSFEKERFKQHVCMHTVEKKYKFDIFSEKFWCNFGALQQNLSLDGETDLILHAYGCSNRLPSYIHNKEIYQQYVHDKRNNKSGQKTQLTKHYLIHNKKDDPVDKPNLCESCGDQLYSSPFLQNYEPTQCLIDDKKDLPVNESYLCESCGNRLSSCFRLQNHQPMQCLIGDKKDLPVDKTCLCESCGNQLSSCPFVQNHQHMQCLIDDKKDHLVDELCLCESCGNQFSSYPLLQIHQQMQCLTVNIIDENTI